MGANWRDCIVSLYDLPGVRKRAPKSGAGSSLMRQLHSLAVRKVPSLTAVAHAYVWNDSVLLLAFVDASTDSYAAAMKDADNFKREVDALRNSYAVAVKGRTFPSVHSGTNVAGQVTVLDASSWAMANCFEIEKRLKHLRAAWYVDGRIASRLRGANPSTKHRVALLPSGRQRVVRTFKGYLWNHAV